MSSLPAYANERGAVILYNPEQQLMDSVFYQSSMHQPFLVDVKGISLERQDPHVDGNAIGNLQSASTLAGGATPGYVNSVYVEKKAKKNNFFLRSKTFSPDGDGYEDFLTFGYEFIVENSMLSLSILDDKGRIINRLIRNKSAGLTREFV